MKYAYRILHPKVTFLLVTKYNDKVNVMALAWHMPIEEDSIAIAVDRENYSYELLSKSREFTLNVLNIKNLDVIWKAGTLSGRKIDKIKKLGLELEQGVKIDTPHIKDCMAFLECKVAEEVKWKEHSIFLSEIVYTWADNRYFKDIWLENSGIPMHVGKNIFTTNTKHYTVR